MDASTMTPLEAAEIMEESARQAKCMIDAPTIFFSTASQSAGVDRLKKCEMAYSLAASLLRAIAAGEYTPVVHAQWEEVNPGHDILFECSNCGRIISTSWGCCEDEDTKGNNGCDPTDEWLNCPSCGALMDGKDDSHEVD